MTTLKLLSFASLLALTISCSGPKSNVVTQAQNFGKAVLSASGNFPYAFGNVSLGNTVNQTFTLTNTGTAAAQYVILPTLNAPFSVQNYSCNAALAVGSTCKFVVAYAPTVVGNANATLNIQYADGALPLTFTGVGVNAPMGHLQLNFNNPFTYGLVNVGAAPVDQVFKFTNDGTAALTLNFTPFAGYFAINPTGNLAGLAACQNGGALQANSSCGLVVRLDPNGNFPYGSVNPVESISVINYVTAGVPASLNWKVAAQLVAPQAPGAIKPYRYDPNNFQAVVIAGTPAQACITLKNEGVLPVTQISYPQPLNAPFAMANFACANPICSATSLAAGASCDVPMTFAPLVAQNYTTPFWVKFHDGYAFQTIQNTVNGSAILPPIVQITVKWTRIPGHAGGDLPTYLAIRDVTGAIKTLGGNPSSGSVTTMTTTISAKLTTCSTFGFQLRKSNGTVLRDTNTAGHLYYIYANAPANSNIETVIINDNNDASKPINGNIPAVEVFWDNNSYVEFSYNGQPFKTFNIEGMTPHCN